jgi:uncharacterized membrane protein
MANTKVKWISKTALMIALLVVLQMLTKPFGQLVTGSCVNAVLAVSVILVGLSCGLTVAFLSPFFAFILGIGPQFFPITPAIALANCVLVIVLHLLCKGKISASRAIIACSLSAFAKFFTLNMLVVQVICNVFALPEKQIAMFNTMFSWPQLTTALIGSAVALLIVPRIKRILK